MGIFNLDHRTRYQDKSRSLYIAAADVPTTVGLAFLAGKAGYTLFVQAITVEVITAAAQSIVFQDSNGTPKKLAALPASAAVGDEHELLYSEEGFACTEGKDLNLIGLAGVECMVTITAYLKPTGTIQPSGI